MYYSKKIHIYIDGKYECTTNEHKTCKEAKEAYIKRGNWKDATPDRIKTSFK